METRILSATKEVIIADDQPTVLIGERINPAGKKKLVEALRTSNLELVRQEALAQVDAGADVLDICVSTFGVDEVALLPQAVETVMEVVEVPLCLDSANPQALEAALKVYQGKPLINSVTGEEQSLARVLPLVREYGGAVIGLTQDDQGIPKDVERRVAIAHRIVERAVAVGIPREDVVIDCLTLAVGVEPQAAPVILEACRRVKAELGVNLVLAISNVSFGLPERGWLNNAFAALAIASGVNCLIGDVAKMRPAVLAADLLLDKDKHARRYIAEYRRRQRSQLEKQTESQ